MNDISLALDSPELAPRVRHDERAFRLPDGRTLGYAVYGEAEGWPVFAFHGTPGSRLVFRPAHDLAKAKGLQLIAVDRPGYGLSSSRSMNTFACWPDDVAELARFLELQSYSVLGISGGGPYAAACAARLRDQINAAALVSPVGPVGLTEQNGNFSTEQKFIFNQLSATPWLSRIAFKAMRSALHNTPDVAYQGLVSRACNQDQEILLRTDIKRVLLDGMTEGMRVGIDGAVEDLRLFGLDWGFDLTSVSVPVRVWQGDADASVPPAAAKLLAEAIPGAELSWLADAGHYWVFEQFEQVLDWLVERRDTHQLM